MALRAALAAALMLAATQAMAADERAPAAPAPGASAAVKLPQDGAARANYDRALKTCTGLEGNQRDVCQAAARLELAQAEAQLHARTQGTALSAGEGRLAVAQAEYDLALQMCEEWREPDRRACVTRATRALAQAKARPRDLEAPEAAASR